MTVDELKTFINAIPPEMGFFNVVNGEFGLAKDGNTFVMTNNEVMTCYIDAKNLEVQFLHQTDKDVRDILTDGDSEETE